VRNITLSADEALIDERGSYVHTVGRTFSRDELKLTIFFGCDASWHVSDSEQSWPHA
jgi:hypothetical protein